MLGDTGISLQAVWDGGVSVGGRFRAQNQLNSSSRLARFNTIPACDRHGHGRTDTDTDLRVVPR